MLAEIFFAMFAPNWLIFCQISNGFCPINSVIDSGENNSLFCRQWWVMQKKCFQGLYGISIHSSEITCLCHFSRHPTIVASQKVKEEEEEKKNSPRIWWVNKDGEIRCKKDIEKRHQKKTSKKTLKKMAKMTPIKDWKKRQGKKTWKKSEKKMQIRHKTKK